MELKLYKVIDGDNVINKTLTNEVIMNINLKADTDIVYPSLVLATNDLIDYQDYNYCHIPLLKRYYFIKGITNINNKIWKLELECDVIETYKTDILTSRARLKRGIRNGDYVNASIDENIYQSVSLHMSDVSFDNSINYVLSAVGE